MAFCTFASASLAFFTAGATGAAFLAGALRAFLAGALRAFFYGAFRFAGALRAVARPRVLAFFFAVAITQFSTVVIGITQSQHSNKKNAVQPRENACFYKPPACLSRCLLLEIPHSQNNWQPQKSDATKYTINAVSTACSVFLTINSCYRKLRLSCRNCVSLS